jgi:thiamine-monophosphate kinase
MSLKEIDIIDKIKTFTSVSGLGDDCYINELDKDTVQLISTDMLVEGNHFLKDFKKYELIGQKAITVNVSDIYACGGMPTKVFVSLALPHDFNKQEINALYQGFDEACLYFDVQINGGDVTSTNGPFVINITVLGYAKKDNVKMRNAAHLGDQIFVTGLLGSAAHNNYPITESYYKIIPREKIQYLIEAGSVNAMTDISDGLARSLYDISSSSNVGVEITKVPRAKNVTVDNVLNGGEDYQMLFTVPKEKRHLFTKEYYHIGEVVEGNSIYTFLDGTKKQIDSFGYDHFGDVT